MRADRPGHRSRGINPGPGMFTLVGPDERDDPEVAVDPIRRVAMISLHTSPLDQPGTGDAGGMNVYVIELSKRLAAQGIAVDIFTRATTSAVEPLVEAYDGVQVRHIHAGPFEGLTKAELPGQLCVFAREVLRAEAAQPVGHYDVVHSHYWLSGQVGALARDRWGVPLVHSMHTMAKVKNDALAEGDTPEPAARIIGEEQVVEAADMLVANTDIEAKQLVNMYDADPSRVEVVHPGVDLGVFRPQDRSTARARLGLPEDAAVLLFAGRIQPLKAPDVLLRAVAELLAQTPELRSRLVVPIVGGPSGSGLEHPESLAQLASELGLDGAGGTGPVVRFVPPVSQEELARWCAAATLVAVPSYNESFGLVAAEAQATGTPVVAAAVGGLTTVVRDGRSGLLVDTHDPRDWADALRRVVENDAFRDRLAAGALEQARLFSWEHTARQTLDVYRRARAEIREAV
ncbi:glycosyl transferase, group 1 [Nocardioides sp. JS614]|uniref:D-inositol 3-phosphate glycosyltransferase n=2 Tax=Nocardioides TaxID=1839 RepID=MSHA_NOCSJ|nr:RecName: Full=D-inositol 3-phosphate glycosyltransferase; AltName: Full=N-acetylglucosamine-inositol-phosphate N-acetylglucosaminyltransferase; Short=GlcNAc-Ins-P N-acetylglucosaminyltransferase [Nocardioides sp. JS614]ABL83547.1 glycosyl transferase, group 1 [Nocardioides sp. JS614]